MVTDKKNSRLPETIGILVMLAVTSWWQYAKYKGGHGLFYYISPTHGAYVLAISAVLVAALMVFLLLRR